MKTFFKTVSNFVKHLEITLQHLLIHISLHLQVYFYDYILTERLHDILFCRIA